MEDTIQQEDQILLQCLVYIKENNFFLDYTSDNESEEIDSEEDENEDSSESSDDSSDESESGDDDSSVDGNKNDIEEGEVLEDNFGKE